MAVITTPSAASIVSTRPGDLDGSDTGRTVTGTGDAPVDPDFVRRSAAYLARHRLPFDEIVTALRRELGVDQATAMVAAGSV